jgi:TP901-1 family phage major tail protein
MAQGYKGRLVLLKVWNAGANTANNSEAVSVLSARTTELTINSESVDITDKSQAGWRILGEDMGLKSMSISLDGVYTNTAVENTIRGYATTGNVFTGLVVTESGDSWKGDFYIPSYSRSGVYNGEETFSLTVESAGAITYANT